jgi:hypothetical protein
LEFFCGRSPKAGWVQFAFRSGYPQLRDCDNERAAFDVLID